MRYGAGSHTLAGWYLQQFLKMGVAESTEALGLSENYVLWDSDMVLVRDFCPFNAQGQVNLMEGSYNAQNMCNRFYEQTFEKLTTLQYVYSQTGAGLTSHHLVVNRKIMREMLATMGQGRNWSTAILEASCPDLEHCGCGFSEYGSYASWMKHRHATDIKEVPRQFKRLQEEIKPPRCCPEQYAEYLKKQAEDGVIFVGFERSCAEDKDYVGAVLKDPKEK